MPVVLNWPLLDPEAICLEQTNAGAGALIINGNLSQGNPPNTYAPFPKFYRTVLLTSNATDNSGVNITINGTLLGQMVSDTIVGPGIGSTVESKQIYDSVTSITTDDQVTDLKAGTGTTGNTGWFSFDYNRSLSASLFQITVTGTIDYSVLETLDNPNLTQTPYLYDLTGSLTGLAINAAASVNMIPYNYATCVINSSDATGSLVFTVIQSGSS
jgi:hypothetical protein